MTSWQHFHHLYKKLQHSFLLSLISYTYLLIYIVLLCILLCPSSSLPLLCLSVFFYSRFSVFTALCSIIISKSLSFIPRLILFPTSLLHSSLIPRYLTTHLKHRHQLCKTLVTCLARPPRNTRTCFLVLNSKSVTLFSPSSVTVLNILLFSMHIFFLLFLQLFLFFLLSLFIHPFFPSFYMSPTPSALKNDTLSTYKASNIYLPTSNTMATRILLLPAIQN